MAKSFMQIKNYLGNDRGLATIPTNPVQWSYGYPHFINSWLLICKHLVLCYELISSNRPGGNGFIFWKYRGWWVNGWVCFEASDVLLFLVGRHHKISRTLKYPSFSPPLRVSSVATSPVLSPVISSPPYPLRIP